jgi:hypothetical protein
MRVRAVEKNAPAEPTSARTAVGFSGEVRQPLCACSGSATERKSAEPRNTNVDFFIYGLQLARYWHKSRLSTEELMQGSAECWATFSLVLVVVRSARTAKLLL